MTVCTRILFAVLLVARVVAGQEPSPRLREVLGKIVSDPRFKDMQKYTDALQPTAKLKQSLMEGERLSGLNYVYGWALTPDGGWPVERINDVMFEIVMSARYDHDVFLEAVETGAPLLRSVRERGCVDAFNRKYELAIPQSGGLPFAQAETFLYDVVGRRGFNAARVLGDVCRDAAPKPAPYRPAPATTSSAALPPPDSGAPENETLHLQARAGIFGGGVLVLGMIALVLWRVIRDRG